jgi:hypothetical protein
MIVGQITEKRGARKHLAQPSHGSPIVVFGLGIADLCPQQKKLGF